MSQARITEMLENNIDDVHGSFSTVTEHEKFTHDGYGFYSSVDITLTAGQTVNLLGETDGRLIHMKSRKTKAISLGQSVDVSTVLYEGSDYTGGTDVDIFNLNRSLEIVTTFSIKQASTGSGKGNDISRGTRIVASKDSAVTEPSDDEYIMKGETKYLLEVTNNAAQTCMVTKF